MNQDRSTNMEEETPKLRSIAIGGPRTTLPPLSRSFPLPGKLSSGPLHVQSTPKPVIAGTPWTVDAILPAISADYMLERTNVYINNSSSQQVADRIVASLSSQSISYKKNEETKNSLLGESHNGLRFYLNLFADSEDSSTVILEVQRLTGCSFAFKGICREVCRASKGMNAAGPPMTRKFPMPCGLPRSTPEQQASRMEAEVARGLAMISSPMLDSQLLGMELLESLSKSPLAAPSLLKEDCMGKMKTMVAQQEELSGLEAKRSLQRKRHALAIIANCLEHASSNLQSDELFVEQVFSSLKQPEDPHCAAQAARCLHSLAASSPATKSFIQGSLELSDTLNSMQTSHHSLLEQECSKLQSLC